MIIKSSSSKYFSFPSGTIVIWEELPIVLSINEICNPSIKEPMNICTETPIVIPIKIRIVCPLLDFRNNLAILNDRLNWLSLAYLNS